MAAGKGSRLYPLTKSVPKPLLGIYDRPMIYYALDFMRAAGIKDVLVVVSEGGRALIENCLGKGEEFGLDLSYRIQKDINGTAGAMREVKDFFIGEEIILYYSDNVLLGNNLGNIITTGIKNAREGRASVLATEVSNPSEYGVLEIDEDGRVLTIEEKPSNPLSNLISPGIYFYPSDLVDKLSKVSLSSRGEYEMTEVNEMYLKDGNLCAIRIPSDVRWSDVGDYDRLLEVSTIVKEMKKLKEEIFL